MKRSQQHPIIGDDLFQGWLAFQAQESAHKGADRFVEWLVSTADGAVALERINSWPRQRALQFPDDDRPWEVVP